MNEEMAALYAALSKAQGAIANPKKTHTANTGTYSYSYADLGATLEAIRKPLAANGLAVLQNVTTNTEAKVVEVETVITHSGGGFLVFGPMSFPATSNAQQTGSGVTYYRRYALSAALGLAAEDDDGKGASETRAPVRVSEPEPDPWQTPASRDPEAAPVKIPAGIRGPAARAWTSGPPSEDQKKYLGALVREAGYPDTITFLTSPEAEQVLGGKPSRPLVKGHASALIDALAEWKASKKTETEEGANDE